MCLRSHSRDCAGQMLWTLLRMRSTTRLFSLKLCEKCGFNSCVCVFFIPWGHVSNHAHIWAIVTSISHMGEMRDSDWSREILLRSDWLSPFVAICTTNVSFRVLCLTFVDMVEIVESFSRSSFLSFSISLFA